MTKPLSVILALLLVIYLVTVFWHSASNVELLVQQALAADEEVQQIQAAQELSRLGKEGLDGLRQVFGESDNAAVISVSLLGLSRQHDYQCKMGQSGGANAARLLPKRIDLEPLPRRLAHGGG